MMAWDRFELIYVYLNFMRRACQRGQLDVVEHLLGAGASVHVNFASFGTPLHLAAGAGHIEVVRQLCSYGANVDAKNQVCRTHVRRPGDTICLFLSLTAFT